MRHQCGRDCPKCCQSDDLLISELPPLPDGWRSDAHIGSYLPAPQPSREVVLSGSAAMVGNVVDIRVEARRLRAMARSSMTDGGRT
jgi:hypothetical protein